MSKQSYTPGPWDYWSGYNPVDELEAQITTEDGDIVIASYNRQIPEGEANAKLLAAAPELLSIAKRWAALDGSAWHLVRYEEEKRELLAATNEAIAKATA